MCWLVCCCWWCRYRPNMKCILIFRALEYDQRLIHYLGGFRNFIDSKRVVNSLKSVAIKNSIKLSYFSFVLEHEPQLSVCMLLFTFGSRKVNDRNDSSTIDHPKKRNHNRSKFPIPFNLLPVVTATMPKVNIIFYCIKKFVCIKNSIS